MKLFKPSTPLPDPEPITISYCPPRTAPTRWLSWQNPQDAEHIITILRERSREVVRESRVKIGRLPLFYCAQPKLPEFNFQMIACIHHARDICTDIKWYHRVRRDRITELRHFVKQIRARHEWGARYTEEALRRKYDDQPDLD